MAEQTIDQLNIEINAKAKSNNNELDKLADSIQRLKSSVGAGVDKLSGIAASLGNLSSTLSGLKSQSGIVSSLANSIDKLNSVKTDNISGSIAALTKSLGTLGGMDPTLKILISDLATLAKSGTGGVSGNALSLEAAAAKAQATIDQSALKSAKAQEGLQTIADKNKAIEDSARAAAQQEQQLTDSINTAIQEHIVQYGSAGGFSNKTATGLESVLPDYGTETSTWPKNAPSEINTESINSLKAAMGEVGSTAASAMSEVSSGSSRATSFVDKLKQSFSDAKDKLSSLGSSSNSFFSMGRFYGWYFILRQIASAFGGFINNINSFIENKNLFDVAMGTSAQAGEKLAQSLQNVLGVDFGEAMRNMGLFEQLTTSFGIVNKQATTMSENLTQLGYDISSFFNIPTSEAFDKLQSGLTGQVRAIRELGIDTSNARLQEELYNLGFKEKVRNLTEADKAVLRYIAIMKQTGNAQGDMARTLSSPANQLRILQAQLQITGRAIGSIFIPALNAILPPVTAVIEVIGDLASELASLFGFKFPKFDYSSLTDITNAADDTADSVGNIGDSAQKSKKQLDNLISGFDELNIIQDNSDEDQNGSGTGSNGGNILGGVDLPTYNTLADAVSSRIDALKQKIKDFLEAFKEDPLKIFADALWGVNGAFSELGKWLSALDYADILNGITAAIMAFGLTKNPILALAIGAIATAISHFLPYKSKIDLLNGSLIALGGALVLKAFTGMPFKLALGISTLLESGLVELIGTDNSINLLTSALTGLGIGMLAFSFTGNLPLAVGIGAVAAAMSGLAIHFSDMQIAPALLSGVVSGLLAFKLGMDSWASGAVGLGVALVSFAELNDLAPELRVGLLGLAGAVTGLGAAFQLGFGPTGMIITAVAGAFIGLGAGIIQAEQDAEKADLEKRFGSIKLSAQECEDVAERLTKTPWTVKIDAAIDANDKLKDMEKTIESDVETLNELNFKVSIGLQLTKEEENDYKTTINSFIKDTKSYIQQQQYSVTLAINASYAPGSDTQKNLLQFVNSYYGGAQKQLDSLGKQLSDEVNKAFSDNVLTEGEYLKIESIEQKMQAIIDKISDAEYKAKLNNLTVDASEKGFTADSFKDLQTQIQKSAQDRLDKADQVRVKAKAAAELKLDEDGDKAAYDKAITEAQAYYDQQKATIELNGVDVSLDTLKTKFSNELKSAEPAFSGSITDAFKNGFYTSLGNPQSQKEVYEQPVTALISGMEAQYSMGLANSNISTATRKELSTLISQLQPTETDLQQIAAASLKAGKEVPSNVAKGISDIEEMKAVTGNSAAIDYEIGKKLSTDSDFLNTLSTSKDAGKSVDKNVAQGLTDNLQLEKDSASGAITGIRDTVTGKTIEITPTLQKNLQDLGINMSNSLVTGVENKTPDGKTASVAAGEKSITDVGAGVNNKQADLKKQMSGVGTNAISSMTNSAQAQGTKDIPLWQQIVLAFVTQIKIKLGIASPSKVFSDIGNNMIQGLWNGIQDTWNGFIGWWSKLKIKVPKLEFGWENLDDFDNIAAKAAKKLGFTEVPTVHIGYDELSWYANGGIFDTPSVIGVGEYSGASSNPEVVAPQSIIRETVTEGNEGLAEAIIAAAEKIVEAIQEKDTSVKLNDKVLATSTNKVNANKGYNLGLST